MKGMKKIEDNIGKSMKKCLLICAICCFIALTFTGVWFFSNNRCESIELDEYEPGNEQYPGLSFQVNSIENQGKYIKIEAEAENEAGYDYYNYVLGPGQGSHLNVSLIQIGTDGEAKLLITYPKSLDNTNSIIAHTDEIEEGDSFAALFKLPDSKEVVIYEE